jgi:hypothetical protein
MGCTALLRHARRRGRLLKRKQRPAAAVETGIRGIHQEYGQKRQVCQPGRDTFNQLLFH